MKAWILETPSNLDYPYSKESIWTLFSHEVWMKRYHDATKISDKYLRWTILDTIIEIANFKHSQQKIRPRICSRVHIWILLEDKQSLSSPFNSKLFRVLYKALIGQREVCVCGQWAKALISPPEFSRHLNQKAPMIWRPHGAHIVLLGVYFVLKNESQFL